MGYPILKCIVLSIVTILMLPIAMADEKLVHGTGGTSSAARQLYLDFCAACHGSEFRGDGPLARGVVPAPVNLAGEAGEHSYMELMHPVMHGEGSMPAWGRVLSYDEVDMLVEYVKHTAPQFSDGEKSGHEHR